MGNKEASSATRQSKNMTKDMGYSYQDDQPNNVLVGSINKPYNNNVPKQLAVNAKNILSHRVSYDQYGNANFNQTRNSNNAGPMSSGNANNGSLGPLQNSHQGRLQNTLMSNQYLNSQSNRIRESSSGALVGKNIVGISGMSGIIGKSSSNLLKDEKLNLANNAGNSDLVKKFQTHNHISSETYQ